MPSVCLHDPRGVALVLDGIAGPGLNKDSRGRNALRGGGAGHHVCLHKMVVCGTTGEKETGSDAAIVLTHRFSYARELLRCGVPVGVCWSAEHKNGVEVIAAGVGSRAQAPSYHGPADQNDDEGKASQGATNDPARAAYLDGPVAMTLPAGGGCTPARLAG